LNQLIRHQQINRSITQSQITNVRT
jgi:hypothetical protein